MGPHSSVMFIEQTPLPLRARRAEGLDEAPSVLIVTPRLGIPPFYRSKEMR